jgi:UDP-N-acetylmuramoylalanine--D-glutamate ligase
MSDYCDFFKGKKITVMGLGVLGRGIGDTQFLSECGAELIVTDLKNEQELAPALAQLKGYTNIQYVLGEHRHEDFRDRDMILKAAGVPLDSPFIETAEAHGIPVEMSASLVARLSGAKVIGVTGTRGKSTVTQLIYHILRSAFEADDAKPSVFLGGNVRGIATLPLLREVSPKDIIVMELDSWQMQGFGALKHSPDISVFTTFFPDHMNYYHNDMQAYFNDKANIFSFQGSSELLITTHTGREAIDTYFTGTLHSRVEVVDPMVIHNPYLPGVHNKENAACSAAAARAVGVSDEQIEAAIASFKGVEGRLQFVREVRGIRIYNDNNATTPDATLAGLRALGGAKNIILIMGGTDKGLSMDELISSIPTYCKAVILLEESGTARIKDDIMALKDISLFNEVTLDACVHRAMDESEEGDIVLFSPAFASFGKFFRNEYDRNDQFLRIVEEL